MTTDAIQVGAGREMDALVAERVMGWCVELSDLSRWSPSTNAADAAQVLEWVVAEHEADFELSYNYHCGSLSDMANVAWEAEFSSRLANPASELAPTASLAICRAALTFVAALTPDKEPS